MCGRRGKAGSDTCCHPCLLLSRLFPSLPLPRNCSLDIIKSQGFPPPGIHFCRRSPVSSAFFLTREHGLPVVTKSPSSAGSRQRLTIPALLRSCPTTTPIRLHFIPRGRSEGNWQHSHLGRRLCGRLANDPERPRCHPGILQDLSDR